MANFFTVFNDSVLLDNSSNSNIVFLNFLSRKHVDSIISHYFLNKHKKFHFKHTSYLVSPAEKLYTHKLEKYKCQTLGWLYFGMKYLDNHSMLWVMILN